MLDRLDAAVLRRWVDLAESCLGDVRQLLDSLNVFPVPDGDTGTNLHLTLVQVRADVADLPDDVALPELGQVIARSALMGARGNSGIITSQLLRGLVDEMDGRTEVDGRCLAAALRNGNAMAWQAVESPVEGTILSVSRAAAEAAAPSAAGPSSVVDVLDAVTDAARAALQATTAQLPALQHAGVVDAGAAGVVVLLEALRAAVTGQPPRALGLEASRVAGEHRGGAAEACPADPPVTASGDGTVVQLEVMYLLEAGAQEAAELRTRLAQLGDSLVVVGTEPTWHVHVHTEDAGAAVEAGVLAGRPSAIRITPLPAALQPTRLPPRQEVEAPEGAAERVGVVAWAAGPGLAELFRACGVVPVTGQVAHRASTGEVLEAVRRTGSRAVVVLPNDPDTLSVARLAAGTAREEGVRVTVVPTKAQVQGLAAAAVHDPTVELEQDVVAMSNAAGATRHGAVTIAAKEAITTAGLCSPGDVLGVVDGDFAVIGSDVAEVAEEVVSRLLSGGGEIVTLVTGEGGDDGLVARVARAVRRSHPLVEVTVVDGGQPRYPLLVGVE
ncbi:MAG: DAK2 domain-containing protein [Actinomycetes bacterium]